MRSHKKYRIISNVGEDLSSDVETEKGVDRTVASDESEVHTEGNASRNFRSFQLTPAVQSIEVRASIRIQFSNSFVHSGSQVAY